jgi:flagellar hook protein FlgE
MAGFSAALSGLSANAQYLSVIGNNLANINTVGFKSSTMTFADLVSQTVGGTSTNPAQIGLGTSVGSISAIFSQGSIEASREATNVAIQGNGFFVLAPPTGVGTSYTRAGNFSLNSTGELVTPDGYKVQKVGGGNITIGAVDSVSIAADGTVTTTTAGVATVAGQIILATFPNDKGLTKAGVNRFTVTAASGAATTGAPGAAGRGSLIGNALETSTVDIAQEFTQMILAQRGYQANSKTITAVDEILVETLNLKR